MYEKHTWVTGEVITAPKLNHIEDGIASMGVMAMQASVQEIGGTSYYVANHTWQEIYDHISDGGVAHVIINDTGASGLILQSVALIGGSGSSYYVVFTGTSTATWTTDSADGYPKYPKAN